MSFKKYSKTPKQDYINSEGVHPYFIWVSPSAMKKMELYCKHCNKEIGWLGTVERVEHNTFYVKDTLLFKQEVHSATCELSPQDMMKIVEEAMEVDAEQGMRLNNELRLWGHSHVNMTVTPSGQDNTQMNTFAYCDYFIRVIANKSGDLFFSIWDYKNNVKITDVPYEIYYPDNVDESAIEAEIAEKVAEMAVTYKANPNSYFSNVRTYNTYNSLEDNDFPWTLGDIELTFTEKEIKKFKKCKDTIDLYDILKNSYPSTLYTLQDSAEIFNILKKGVN